MWATRSAVRTVVQGALYVLIQHVVQAAIPLPKTVCLPFSHDVMTVVMKNWEPLVLGPALAMLSNPATSCFSAKFSSCGQPQVTTCGTVQVSCMSGECY